MTNSSVFRATSSPSLSARTLGRLPGCPSHHCKAISPLSPFHRGPPGFLLKAVPTRCCIPCRLMITHACFHTPLHSHSHTCTLLLGRIYSRSQSLPYTPRVFQARALLGDAGLPLEPDSQGLPQWLQNLNSVPRFQPLQYSPAVLSTLTTSISPDCPSLYP